MPGEGVPGHALAEIRARTTANLAVDLQENYRLASRVALVGLGLLSAGIIVGVTRLDAGELDAAMTVTVVIWPLYAAALALRWEAGLRGSRLAWSLVAGFALVTVVLPLTHFAS